MTTKVIVTVGWFKKPKDQFVVAKHSPTTKHPRRFEIWFARDTFTEVVTELNHRCKKNWTFVDFNVTLLEAANEIARLVVSN